MRNIRKLAAVLLSVLLLFSLAACRRDEKPESGSAPGMDSSYNESSEPAGPVDTSGDSSDVSEDVNSPDNSDGGSKVDGTTTKKPDGSKVTTTKKPDGSKVTTTTGNNKTTKPSATVTDYEKPVTTNTAILYNGQTSSYDSQAETMRQNILNTKDQVKPSTTGKTYYVSYKGNDKNDGLTPATAWRSTTRVGKDPYAFSNGDVILFERGGVYRGKMKLWRGVSVGAYGSGPKPALYGSLQNYADESLWKETSTKNVWQLDVGKNTPDVGMIVFDHGKDVAAEGKKCATPYKLTKNFDFYHNVNRGRVELYCDKGNPGKIYSDIEVCSKDNVIGGVGSGVPAQNIRIDNLCIKYTGSHGIGFGNSTGTPIKNITVTNCEIGWIGGSLLDKTVRYGNGFEVYGETDGLLFENNWVYMCFDTGYTNQGGPCTQQNITVRNNLIEYCNYNIEIWVDKTKGKIANTVYENNVLRFAGYGFGTSTESRFGSNNWLTSCFLGMQRAMPCDNVIVQYNVFDTSWRTLVVSAYADGVKGPLFKGNTWIQHNDTNSAVALTNDTDVDGWNHARFTLPAGDLATMKNSVAQYDKTATVKFERK